MQSKPHVPPTILVDKDFSFTETDVEDITAKLFNIRKNIVDKYNLITEAPNIKGCKPIVEIDILTMLKKHRKIVLKIPKNAMLDTEREPKYIIDEFYDRVIEYLAKKLKITITKI